jgi:DNA-binding transcriptional MocR family regulator
MHLMVRFDDHRIGERAADAGVQLAGASSHYLSGAPRGEFIFGFSAIGERTIREGVRRLAGSVT